MCMPMNRRICLVTLVVLLSWSFFCNSYAQDAQKKPSTTEGEFAVKIIKHLKWENNLPVAAVVEDYIRVLELCAIAPLEGWDKDRRLTEENRIEVLACMAGLEKTLYEKAIKACKNNVNIINEVQQRDGGKRDIEEVLCDKKYFPVKQPKCPWGMPYRFVGGKAVPHYHLTPVLSIQEKEIPASVFTKAARKSSKFRVSISALLDQVYETNIFFAYLRKEKDYKFTYKPFIDVSYTDKDIFANVVNYSEFGEYLSEAIWTFENDLMARLSYYPTDTASWGVRNRYTTAKKAQLTTIGIDRILALGYYTNVLDMGFKFTLPKKLTTSFGYSLEDVNFTSSVYKIGPSKKTSKFFIRESYSMGPKLSPYADYYLKLIDFDYNKDKSGWINGFGLGTDFKLPRVANINANGAFEIRENSGINQFPTDPREYGFVYGTKVESTFSQSTQVYLEYTRKPFVEASGTNYRQFSSQYISGRISQRLPYLMTFSLSGLLEMQYFKQDDSFLAVLDNRLIVTNNYNAELRKSLTADVWVNVKYTYLRRDSDFTQDSYLDNLVTISIGARF